MSEKKILLNRDDVVSINNYEDKIILSHVTFQVKEFVEDLMKQIDKSEERREKWGQKGVECEILSPNTGWKKGKIRITLEFIPEEPESILDDIRQTIS
ncbi:KGK family protein [Aphanothece hegewaldii CCALA 016]|uniref:KGK family protein n=1 Tax=Aphanothece hegewaldii CCALA 016 TaxID=2107694 RepID=A0A2T1LTE0_9CHRO|nr:KGK domain-containing protein [Aphanothece hegewaldii]PSF33604.1 KGK family protein [Aphanothece hegewaldii CCALA 016]